MHLANDLYSRCLKGRLKAALRSSILLMFGFCTQTAMALEEDSQKPIYIMANGSQFNYKTGVNSYEGDVKIDQGTQHVSADRVVTTNNEKHKIETAIAYGLKQPAVYSTIPKIGDPVFEAKADIIKFYPTKSIIILEGSVIVTQGENSFHGPVIIYNTKDQIVTAPASNNGRATIVIKPDQQ